MIPMSDLQKKLYSANRRMVAIGKITSSRLQVLARRGAIAARLGLQRLSGRLNRFWQRTQAYSKQAPKTVPRMLQQLPRQLEQIRRAPADQDATAAVSPVPATRQRTPRLPDGECVYAIGDVHGRFDLLLQLFESIEMDARQLPPETRVTIVCLGDYIDRGMQSRQVIDLLMSDRFKAYETVFLMGNHEEALLKFRNDPGFGPIWARYGGIETMYSYGLQPPQIQGRIGGMDDPEVWQGMWDEFRQKLPSAHLEFYQSLKHYFSLGDYLFVHAGLRPHVPLEDQTTKDMLWIRDEFLEDPFEFEHFIVHGHTPTDEVRRDNRRIGLDTGAYYSGQLTAAKFLGTDIAIIST